MADEAAILNDITLLFRGIFLCDDLVLTLATTAADVPGWDSFKHIEIIMAIEGEFGIKLTSREVDGFKRVGDLVKIVALKA